MTALEPAPAASLTPKPIGLVPPGPPRVDRTLLIAASGLLASRVMDGLAAGTDRFSEQSPSSEPGLTAEVRNATPQVGNLYAGRLGAALFLSARGQIAGDDQAKDVALRVAEETVDDITSGTIDSSRAGIGGFVGLGGLIYGLTRIAQLTGEHAFAEAAQGLAGRLSADVIASDRHLDVVHGSAGALLAFLALPDLDRPSGDGLSALDRAEICARHLLRRGHGSDGHGSDGHGSDGHGSDGHGSDGHGSEDGSLAFVPPGDQDAKSGFAHGAAGIAAALARLHKHRPRPEWPRAICQALDFVRRHYDPELDNWTPTLGDQVFTLGWCHGAPGVALAHLSIGADLPAADRGSQFDRFEHDLQASLTACEKHRPTPLDHLCCGNMSRAETFLVAHHYAGSRDPAGQQATNTALLDQCHRFALWVLRSAKTHGRFGVSQDPSSAYSFFQGLSGIGYGLLRIAEPRELPCVLLME